MILTKFFKPKWQHKDAPVRITALNTLSAEDDEHIAIICNLIENDTSELVRRAALIKLDQYAYWLAASRTNTNSSIRGFAANKVQTLILDQSPTKLVLKLKQEFLNQCDKTAFLEQWLLAEQELTLIELLLTKVNKPHLLMQFIINCKDEELQLSLLPRFETIDQLEKLVKKINAGKVADAIHEKIYGLQLAIDKPIKLKKQSQLVLSKLLALKDLHDYSDMRVRKLSLEQEWQVQVAEFDCLSANEKDELLNKYNSISRQLTKSFAVQEEAYQHEQFIAAQAQKKVEQLNTLNDQVKIISQQITQAVFENISIDENKLEAQLTDVKALTLQSELTEQDQQLLFNKLAKLENKLKQLPHVAQCVSDATALISKLSTLALPTTIEELNLRQPVFNEWTQQWRRIDNLVDDILPESIISARNELELTWQQTLKPLVKEQDTTFVLVSKKISELKRLISFGKYKSAFGLHKKLTFMIEALSTEHQDKLEKDFTLVSDKITELHELESFIVTPKKQQTLDDILKLINSPLDNPIEQAKEIKRFRGHWNNLGRADETMEADLNNKFNELIELAFAPCRQYYAEQATSRAANLTLKQAVIEKLQSLNAELNNVDVNLRQIDTRLHKLILVWRDIGEVDREQHQIISKQFSGLVDPVRFAVNSYHDKNAEQKMCLIDKAKLELDNEDVFAAINTLKGLQKQWSNIEYAGNNKENQLWQSFRKINDQMFSRRDETKESEQKERLAQTSQFENECSDLLEQVNAAIELTSLKALKPALKSFEDKLKTQSPVNKVLLTKVQNTFETLLGKVKRIEAEKVKSAFVNLFIVIDQISTGNITSDTIESDEHFSLLSKHWQKIVSSNCALVTDFIKQDVLTIELEILADLPSPKNVMSDRMQVQVNMLADKLKSGESSSLDGKLENWINCGLNSKQLNVNLERVKQIFIPV